MSMTQDDIMLEAMCRIAENAHIAEVDAREKAIRAHMQKMEYDALPKCAHGLPNDAGTWRDHYERYHPLSAHPHRIRPFPISHVPRCEHCIQEALIRKQRADAEQAAAVAAEAARINAERAAEREREAKLARAKHIEEKTAELQNNTMILNFVGLEEPAWHAETYYLRRESAKKYVPIADGIHVVDHGGGGRPLLGNRVWKTPTPVQWATHFAEGLIPFLPVCPCCDKPTQMVAARMDRGGEDRDIVGNTERPLYERYIHVVICNSDMHYGWEASSGKHYKNGVKWDPKGPKVPKGPKDPEGAKAAIERRVVELAAAEAQMAKLQAKIQRLRDESNAV